MAMFMQKYILIIVACIPRFNRYRNILKQSIKDAKRIYFQSIFAKFKHDIKRTWSIINESLHRKTISSRIFYHNGKTLEDPSEIANAFNEYFISIGPSISKATVSGV